MNNKQMIPLEQLLENHEFIMWKIFAENYTMYQQEMKSNNIIFTKLISMPVKTTNGKKKIDNF